MSGNYTSAQTQNNDARLSPSRSPKAHLKAGVGGGFIETSPLVIEVKFMVGRKKGGRAALAMKCDAREGRRIIFDNYWEHFEADINWVWANYRNPATDDEIARCQWLLNYYRTFPGSEEFAVVNRFSKKGYSVKKPALIPLCLLCAD
jgi:hypothetical protein